MNPNNTPPSRKGGRNKKDGRAIGIRFDMGQPLEREAYEYIESQRGNYTPRQIVVSALVCAARGGHYPSTGTKTDQEAIYNAMVDALTRVISEGKLVLTDGNLSVEKPDGSFKAIMSQEAQTLLNFVEKLGEF